MNRKKRIKWGIKQIAPYQVRVNGFKSSITVHKTTKRDLEDELLAANRRLEEDEAFEPQHAAIKKRVSNELHTTLQALANVITQFDMFVATIRFPLTKLSL